MKLDAIGIVVSNVKRSIEFYRLLGLAFPELEEGVDHVEASTSSGLRVMLDSETLMKQLDPKWEKPQGQRSVLAFLCESPEVVDREYSKILRAGFEGKKPPWDAFWGQRYASVLDPDGNSVDLFCPLEPTP